MGCSTNVIQVLGDVCNLLSMNLNVDEVGADACKFRLEFRAIVRHSLSEALKQTGVRPQLASDIHNQNFLLNMYLSEGVSYFKFVFDPFNVHDQSHILKNRKTLLKSIDVQLAANISSKLVTIETLINQCKPLYPFQTSFMISVPEDGCNDDGYPMNSPLQWLSFLKKEQAFDISELTFANTCVDSLAHTVTNEPLKTDEQLAQLSTISRFLYCSAVLKYSSAEKVSVLLRYQSISDCFYDSEKHTSQKFIGMERLAFRFAETDFLLSRSYDGKNLLYWAAQNEHDGVCSLFLNKYTMGSDGSKLACAYTSTQGIWTEYCTKLETSFLVNAASFSKKNIITLLEKYIDCTSGNSVDLKRLFKALFPSRVDTFLDILDHFKLKQNSIKQNIVKFAHELIDHLNNSQLDRFIDLMLYYYPEGCRFPDDSAQFLRNIDKVVRICEKRPDVISVNLKKYMMVDTLIRDPNQLQTFCDKLNFSINNLYSRFSQILFNGYQNQLVLSFLSEKDGTVFTAILPSIPPAVLIRNLVSPDPITSFAYNLAMKNRTLFNKCMACLSAEQRTEVVDKSRGLEFALSISGYKFDGFADQSKFFSVEKVHTSITYLATKGVDNSKALEFLFSKLTIESKKDWLQTFKQQPKLCTSKKSVSVLLTLLAKMDENYRMDFLVSFTNIDVVFLALQNKMSLFFKLFGTDSNIVKAKLNKVYLGITLGHRLAEASSQFAFYLFEKGYMDLDSIRDLSGNYPIHYIPKANVPEDMKFCFFIKTDSFDAQPKKIRRSSIISSKPNFIIPCIRKLLEGRKSNGFLYIKHLMERPDFKNIFNILTPGDVKTIIWIVLRSKGLSKRDDVLDQLMNMLADGKIKTFFKLYVEDTLDLNNKVKVCLVSMFFKYAPSKLIHLFMHRLGGVRTLIDDTNEVRPAIHYLATFHSKILRDFIKDFISSATTSTERKAFKAVVRKGLVKIDRAVNDEAVLTILQRRQNKKYCNEIFKLLASS